LSESIKFTAEISIFKPHDSFQTRFKRFFYLRTLCAILKILNESNTYSYFCVCFRLDSVKVLLNMSRVYQNVGCEVTYTFDAKHNYLYMCFWSVTYYLSTWTFYGEFPSVVCVPIGFYG
jgi:hypothetical protein